MASGIDVLFVTRINPYRETGDVKIHKPIRLEIEKLPATVSYLRLLADGKTPDEALKILQSQRVTSGNLPVLTSIYLNEYLSSRGIRFEEIECLAAETERVKELSDDGVGMIALSTTWLSSLEGAREVREAGKLLRSMAPDTPIIAGGVGVRKGYRARRLLNEGAVSDVSRSELSEKYLLIDPALDRDFDAFVVAEGGEETLLAVASAVKNNEDYKSCPNLALPVKTGYEFTRSKPETLNLNSEIIDWSSYVKKLGGYGSPIRTGTGCPFRCGFCDFTELYKVRLRSVDSLISELKTIGNEGSGPHPVFFTDDNLAAGKQRLQRLAKTMVKENFNLNWRGFLHADVIDKETAELLSAAGCRECFIGIESGDAEVLRNMRKKHTPEQAIRALEALDNAGISTMCTFVVGFPGECERSVHNTAQLISAFPSGDSARVLHRYYLFRFELTALCPAARPEARAQFGLKGSGENWRHTTMNAAEAGDAVREIFTNVSGPSHVYLELFPPEWPIDRTRKVIELRDEIQKQKLKGVREPDLDELLRVVRESEPQ